MYNNFVVEGEKMVLELVQDTRIEIEHLLCTTDWQQAHHQEIDHLNERVLLATPNAMQQISSLKTAPPVLAVVRKLDLIAAPEQIASSLSLYLDGIQNPGNFGTILRIADWFGIPFVFCSADTADLYNPKVIQATMGAFLRVNVIFEPLVILKAAHPQLPIYGTVLEGQNIYETPLSQTGIIIIGSEGKGISEALRPLISNPIAIPAHPDGGAESLNVAVATGIVCAAFRNNG